jgi:hypothetical protein
MNAEGLSLPGESRPKHSQEGKAPQREPVGRLFLNFFWIIFLGVGVLSWVWRFTDHLSTAVGLLGLGGIFTWVAFLGDVVRENRKDQLRDWLERTMMKKRASMALAGVTVLMVVWGLCFGCVVIDSTEDNIARIVTIGSVTAGAQGKTETVTSLGQTRILPGSRRKLPVFMGLSGKTCRIEVEGLPRVEKQIRRFRRNWLDTPRSFSFRNLVLVHPSPEVTQTSAKEGFKHEAIVTVTGQQPVTMPFEGRAFWIGCRREVAIPSVLREKWRLDLLMALLRRTGDAHPSRSEAILARWFSPDAVDPVLKLVPGQDVSVVVRTPGETRTFASGSARVGRSDERDLPQVLSLQKHSQ